MSWKNWPSWVKGGVIFAVVPLINNIIFFFLYSVETTIGYGGDIPYYAEFLGLKFCLFFLLSILLSQKQIILQILFFVLIGLSTLEILFWWFIGASIFFNMGERREKILEDWPCWLRWGSIFGFFVLINNLILIFSYFFGAYAFSLVFSGLNLPIYFIYYLLKLNLIIISIFGILFWFGVGAVIGLVIGKIKTKSIKTK